LLYLKRHIHIGTDYYTIPLYINRWTEKFRSKVNSRYAKVYRALAPHLPRAAANRPRSNKRSQWRGSLTLQATGVSKNNRNAMVYRGKILTTHNCYTYVLLWCGLGGRCRRQRTVGWVAVFCSEFKFNRIASYTNTHTHTHTHTIMCINCFPFGWSLFILMYAG